MNVEKLETSKDSIRGVIHVLTDESIQMIESTISDGGTKRPKEDKIIAQAVRALEKASRHIDQLIDSESTQET